MIKQIIQKWKNRKPHRLLQVSTAGKWYLLLTIALGVVALSSGNNVIYIIESILLGGLILSGIISERFISSVEVSFIYNQAQVDGSQKDCVIVKNTGNRDIYCIEISEWNSRGYQFLAFFPKIEAKKESRVWIDRKFTTRGYYESLGFSISTRYPFGFAKKSKPLSQFNQRIVWPKAIESDLSRSHHSSSVLRGLSYERSEGEVRPYVSSDDARWIATTPSLKGSGLMVRPHVSALPAADIFLNLDQKQGQEFELEIQEATALIQKMPSITLTFFQKNKAIKKIESKNEALNALAVVQAMGGA